LYSQISVPLEAPFVYDLSKEGDSALAELLARNSKRIIITEDQPFPLKRNTFVLARTLETVKLPLDLAARIEGKSSRARCGVLVHFTAPTVHPGWQGPLTLEMINLGPAEFMLRPGMPIAQLILEQVYGTPVENESQFQGQTTPEGL
jgi:dCTP deaminase